MARGAKWGCSNPKLIDRFELSTASESSLVSLLAIYFDHIFNPNLLERDFKTEVYDQDEETGVMWVAQKQKSSFLARYIFYFDCFQNKIKQVTLMLKRRFERFCVYLKTS